MMTLSTRLSELHDNFYTENSQVIPVLLSNFQEFKSKLDREVITWSIGKPVLDFLYVDEIAITAIHVMHLNKSIYDENTESMLSYINIGTGVDCTIRELVETVAKVVGFEGEIKFVETKPHSAPWKLINVKRQKSLGWEKTQI